MRNGQPPVSGLRSLTPLDLAQTVEVVVDAFADYPYWAWLEPDPQPRAELMGRYYDADLLAIVSAEASMGVSGRGDGGFDAVALWLWCDGTDDGEVFDSPALSLVGGAAGNRLVQAMSAMADLAPDGRYWYLDVLASRRAHQRQGLGAQLLRHGLARADTQRASVYLETSEPRNVGLYEHFGFEVTADVTVEGLWLCGMTRPPLRS